MTMIGQRINTVLLIMIVLMLGSVIAMFASVARGGPLDPPAPPASTDAVKLPGTPISALPYAITQPGHYYLTRGFDVSGSVIAIDIQHSNVSLDLGGFTIDGNDAVGSYGVFFRDTENVEVRNGTISDFQFGIQASGADLVRLDDVHTHSNARGIELGFGALLTNCTSIQNSETGISVPDNLSVVRDCLAINNAGGGISVDGIGNTVESSEFINNGAQTEVEARLDNNGGSFVDNKVYLDIVVSGNGIVVADNVCQTASADIINTGTNNVVGAPDHANVNC